jgi:hypothetical protein
MDRLTLADITASIEAGDRPTLTEFAELHLLKMEKDHVTVVTAALGEEVFPTFLVRLSPESADFCGATGSKGVPPPDFGYAAYHDRRGNTVVEMRLLFPQRNAALHLPLDPTHPFVINWLDRSCDTPVFGITYALPDTEQFFSWFGERDEEHVAWFERNSEAAHSLRPDNDIEPVITARAEGIDDEYDHRFLTFDEIDLPLLLAELGMEPTLDQLDFVPDFDVEWLAETHGIALTLEERNELPNAFYEGLVNEAIPVRDQPRRYLTTLQQIAADHTEDAFVLRLLHDAAEDVDPIAQTRYRRRIASLKDSSLSHLLLYLDTLDREPFIWEMAKLPRPHSILDHPPADEENRYLITDFVKHEELAGRYECLQEKGFEAILRLDRLLRFGANEDQTLPLTRGIVMNRIGSLGLSQREDQLMSYSDLPSAVRRQLHPETLDHLRLATGDLLAELAEEVYQEPVRREGRKVGRNEPCPCGSGRKYKRCCGRK